MRWPLRAGRLFNRAQPGARSTLGRDQHPFLGQWVKPAMWQVSVQHKLILVEMRELEKAAVSLPNVIITQNNQCIQRAVGVVGFDDGAVRHTQALGQPTHIRRAAVIVDQNRGRGALWRI